MSTSPEELSQLLDSHWGPLVAWVGSVADPEDIVQQSFVALVGLAVRPDNPRAWLYKTAKNKSINAHKSAQRRSGKPRTMSFSTTTFQGSLPQMILKPILDATLKTRRKICRS